MSMRSFQIPSLITFTIACAIITFINIHRLLILLHLTEYPTVPMCQPDDPSSPGMTVFVTILPAFVAATQFTFTD